MVLVRNGVLMGLLTLSLAMLMCAAPLPLFTSDWTDSATNATSKISVSFFEKCPLNESNHNRVVATKCQVYTIDDSPCGSEKAVMTLGKIAVVGAICFTGFSVVIVLISEHFRREQIPRTITVVFVVLAVIFTNLWWIMCVVATQAMMCGSVAASGESGFALGSQLPVACVATAIVIFSSWVVYDKERWADKSF